MEQAHEEKRGRTGRLARAALFLLLLLALFSVLNDFFQPIWLEWNNYNTTCGFYKEPDNTIETLFLGSSITLNGFIPVELYENYGICAYNFGTEQQPMFGSYYLAMEAYRLHPKTLRTIVWDITRLMRQSDKAFYHKAIDNMRFSWEVKFRAVRDYSERFGENALLNLVPLLSYHERWKSLKKVDFAKSEIAPDLSVRGYNFSAKRRIDSVKDYTAIQLPLYIAEKNAGESECDEEGQFYLEKMISFCKAHNIRLVLTALPRAGWDSSWHKAVQAIADENQLAFLDFNFDPCFSEIDFNFALDSIDSVHLNYYGASKVTKWLGDYLVKECGARDVRGDSAYAFMEAELSDFRRSIKKIGLNRITDPAKYLASLAGEHDYAVFVSVKDEAANKLTPSQKKFFSSVGLKRLSQLTYRASCLAVIDNGTILTEKTEKDPGGKPDAPKEQPALSCSGSLSDGAIYEITSGGFNLGNVSSIRLNGKEYSARKRGLNLVVYDKQSGKVIDTAVFDTCATSERPTLDYARRLEKIKASGKPLSVLSGIDRQLCLYDRAREERKLLKLTAGDGTLGLPAYLSAFWDVDESEIYISVKGDAAGALTDETRNALNRLGLKKLSALRRGDSYLAVIKKGYVLLEESASGEKPVSTATDGYFLLSGGMNSGKAASIMIGGREYSSRKNGLNVVIYDTERKSVIARAVF